MQHCLLLTGAYSARAAGDLLQICLAATAADLDRLTASAAAVSLAWQPWQPLLWLVLQLLLPPLLLAPGPVR